MPALKNRYDFTYKGYPIAAALDRIESRRLTDRDADVWGVWTNGYFTGRFKIDSITEYSDIRRAACKVALSKKN